MSRSSFEEVSMTTGNMRVRSFALTRCSTSRPSTFGNRRSSSTTLGRIGPCMACSPVANSRSNASAPSLAQTSLFPKLCFFSALMQSSASVALSSTKRTSIGDCGSGICWFPCGQREVERRSVIGLTDGPGPTAVAGHDTLDDCEADASAAEFMRAVQTTEQAEQLFGVSHVEAGTIVLDPIYDLAIVTGAAYLDKRAVPAGRIFDRIVQEVIPHAPQHHRIPLRRWQRGHCEAYVATRHRPRELWQQSVD